MLADLEILFDPRMPVRDDECAAAHRPEPSVTREPGNGLVVVDVQRDLAGSIGCRLFRLQQKRVARTPSATVDGKPVSVPLTHRGDDLLPLGAAGEAIRVIGSEKDDLGGFGPGFSVRRKNVGGKTDVQKLRRMSLASKILHVAQVTEAIE